MNELTINEWRNAVFDSELNTSAKIVGLAIARYWRPDKLCYPSISTLTIDCSLSKPSVIAAIKALKNAGLIKIKKGELKYLTSLQNFYELVGVSNSQDDSKNDGKDNGKDDGKDNGKSNGKTNGKIILPEISEISEVREINKKNISKKDFQKPTFEEVEAYCKEKKLSVNPQTFFDYFEAGNWTDAKGQKVKNWKQKILTWQSHQTKAPEKIPKPTLYEKCVQNGLEFLESFND